jgi:hypothetical protein
MPILKQKRPRFFAKFESGSTRSVNVDVALAVAFFLPSSDAFNLDVVRKAFKKARRHVFGVRGNRDYYRFQLDKFFYNKAKALGLKRKDRKAFFAPTPNVFNGTQLRLALALYYTCYHGAKLTQDVLTFFAATPANEMFQPGAIFFNAKAALGMFACRDRRVGRRMYRRLL